MATLSRGTSYGASETITNTKLHNLVDLGSVSQIVDADCSASMNLTDTKLADITTTNKVKGTALGNLASIPSGAGIIPFLNLPLPLGSTYCCLTSIPNSSLQPIVLPSWVDGASMRNIQSMPSSAGQLSWFSVVSSLASGGSLIYDGVNKLVGGSSRKQFTAGNYLVVSNNWLGTMQGTSPVKVSEIFIPRSGTLRVKFYIAKAGGTTVFGQIYKNGSAVGTLQSTLTSTGTQYSEDISGWSAGDLCQLYIYNSNGAQDTFGIGLSIFEGDPDTALYNFSLYPSVMQYIGNSLPTALLTGVGNIGDTYISTAGGASTTLYIKTGSSTWTAK